MLNDICGTCCLRFSSTCSLDSDGQPTCDSCPPGYTGRRCERYPYLPSHTPMFTFFLFLLTACLSPVDSAEWLWLLGEPAAKLAGAGSGTVWFCSGETGISMSVVLIFYFVLRVEEWEKQIGCNLFCCAWKFSLVSCDFWVISSVLGWGVFVLHWDPVVEAVITQICIVFLFVLEAWWCRICCGNIVFSWFSFAFFPLLPL